MPSQFEVVFPLPLLRQSLWLLLRYKKLTQYDEIPAIRDYKYDNTLVAYYIELKPAEFSSSHELTVTYD